jgi:hypothetical protein
MLDAKRGRGGVGERCISDLGDTAGCSLLATNQADTQLVTRLKVSRFGAGGGVRAGRRHEISFGFSARPAKYATF